MADKKVDIPEINPLDKPGFHLLKPGKKIVIGGRQFIRTKDIEIKKGDKKHVEKNIKKISYVPNSLIKSLGVEPDKLPDYLKKHFEPKPVDELPKFKHENIKNMQTRLNK